MKRSATTLRRAMGSHQRPRPQTTTWLTPPEIIDALGSWRSFALDPCGYMAARGEARPIKTAVATFYRPMDGLAARWPADRRIWLNPPYTTGEIGPWLARLADHGAGTALIFARTETDAFFRHVWERATGLLFLEGRLHFHYPDGRRAKANAGAPSVLCAYGFSDQDVLADCGLAGAFVPLRLRGSVAVLALTPSWRDALVAWVKAQDGPVVVADAYRAFRGHAKARRNPNWRAKIRQTFQRGPFNRVGPATWEAAA